RLARGNLGGVYADQDRLHKVGHKDIDMAESHCWILVSERLTREYCLNLRRLTCDEVIASRLTAV
ncbi:hypothetical protein N8837_06300, partial [Pseudomonadales bacterium]|nr:hypothetical protein [Pseudomonadales bacterium]